MAPLRLREILSLLNKRGGLMGMLFQEDSLFTGLPVYENAAYRLESTVGQKKKLKESLYVG